MNRVSKIIRRRKCLLAVLLTATVLAVSGCQTIGFYAQAAKGQYQIFAHKKSIDKVIADPQTPVALREQLKLVAQLRDFARDQLKLPVDGNYLKYVDVHRPYVVWNVQATPQFSLQPRTWWYPLVGSLEYRGYFSEHGATNYAGRIARKDDDVYVDGVEAYSTLGWFKDPVLNTFIDLSEPELAEVIFHELGHRRVFARGDTDFNEAYATTVGQEGARRWLRASGKTNLLEKYAVALRRNDQFVHLIMSTREQLEKVYGDTLDKDGKVKAAKIPPLPPAQLKEQKQRVFAELRAKYEQLKTGWGGYRGYDEWFARELNNAQLNTIANYYDFLPAFKRLLDLNDGNMEKFYQAVERLSKMDKDQRHQSLRNLAKGNGPPS
ncbi:MAG TPA: aminopeptidase [Verrucomicrobiae bacterium]|jgi:predicted aminopeptidase|nr:aminopeptidase [Verrucomicrobiae bacterium]